MQLWRLAQPPQAQTRRYRQGAVQTAIILAGHHLPCQLRAVSCAVSALTSVAFSSTMPLIEHASSSVEGCPQLDRAAFSQSLHVPALRVPKQRCNQLMHAFKGYTFDRPKMRSIITPEGADAAQFRLVLLEQGLDVPAGLPLPLQALLTEGQIQVLSHTVVIDYTHLNAEQVLKAYLPAGVEVPSSFETVGHIVHLNLREELMPYKHIIGQVLLDKNPHVKTVVNKVGAIDNEFRVFSMELLAGEARTETEVVQHGARFQLDFAQVYWNSRLEAEHQRLVERYFEPGQVVVDIMAGIGPFAVPAAQQGCTVYANDLNPASIKYMHTNVKLNRVAGTVHVFNMDGRAFTRLLCDAPPMAAPPAPVPAPASIAPPAPVTSSQAGSAGQPDKQQTLILPGVPSTGDGSEGGAYPVVVPLGFKAPPGGLVFQHAVMNLPASAVEFLDAFNGAFNPQTWRGHRLPLVHVYTFQTPSESSADVVAKVERYLGGSLDEPPTIHIVRDVAPNKHMLCVTFRLPAAVVFAGRSVATSAGDATASAVAAVAGQSAAVEEEKRDDVETVKSQGGEKGEQSGAEGAEQAEGAEGAAKRQRT